MGEDVRGRNGIEWRVERGDGLCSADHVKTSTETCMMDVLVVGRVSETCIQLVLFRKCLSEYVCMQQSVPELY